MTRAFDRTVLALAAATLAWSCIEIARLRYVGLDWFADWQTYALAWLRVADGEALYAPAQVSGPYRLPEMFGQGYAYPPASVVMFAPFASWPAGFVAWTTVNVGTLLTGMWAVATRISPMRRTIVYAAFLLFFAGYFPFRDGVFAGNLSVATAGLFAWAYVLGERVAAPLGAVAAVIRLTPGVLAIAGWRHRRAVLLALGFAAALVLLTLPIVGVEAWFEYPAVLANAVPHCYAGNFGVGCLLPDIPQARWAVVGLAIIPALGAALAARHAERVVFAGLAYLMASAAGDLHRHYWLLLAVLPALLIADVLTRRRLASRVQPLSDIDSTLIESAAGSRAVRRHPRSAAAD